MVLGHEAAGIVDAVGEGVNNIVVGDPVVLEPLIPCGSCFPCSIGRSNCCSNMKTIGVTTNGSLSECFAVPASCLHKIPPTLPFHIAALSEPFSIGFHASSRGKVSFGDQVVILGAGTIGLTILAAAKQKGARVLISDILDFRLGIAEKMGADVVINSKKDDIVKSVLDWTGGTGAGVVIEAVGSPTTIESTIDFVADAGRVVIVGVTSQKFCMAGVDITKKELSIIGSRNNLGRFEEAIAYVSSHQEIAGHLITHTYDFPETENAFRHASRHPDNTCKVIINLNE
jgi:threonine dehydrogenase-like Zn-dependent dehydrogenase